jgi:hypothetical protein
MTNDSHELSKTGARNLAEPLRIWSYTVDRVDISVFKCHHSIYLGSWSFLDYLSGKVKATTSTEETGGFGRNSGSSTRQTGHCE